MSDPAGADVKASVRSRVTRAQLEVEVEGEPHQIGEVFDSILASVAKHFPGASIDVNTATVEDEDAPVVHAKASVDRGQEHPLPEEGTFGVATATPSPKAT